jgi:mono/diheme cytochrome c family protein
LNRPIARSLLLGAAALVLTTAFVEQTPAFAPSVRTVWDSVYSSDQAARGETAYVKTCARCHQASLAGADESPALAGSMFLGNWNGQTLAALHDRIRTSMPPEDPGTYSRQLVTDVIAYMLKVNGFPAGATALSTEADSLKVIVLQSTKP